MATLNKTAKAPVQGNNIAPNPTELGGNYFNTNGNAISVETRVICNRVVLITTLPDDLEAGAYVALVSVTGEISRVSWLDNPTGLFWNHRLKKAVKQLIKFEKDDIPPVVVKVEKPETTVVEEPVVPPSPVEPTPAAPASAKPETTVYKATSPVEPTVQPQPVPVEEPAPAVESAVVTALVAVTVEEAVVTVEPKVEPVPAPVEPKVEPETTVQPEPQPQPPVDNKKSSGKLSLKDIANEDKVAKQKNKYRPGKNSRAQMLAESQRVMQQRKHAKA